MTLIVWDGTTLAADKLRKNDAAPLNSRKCSTVEKISVFSKNQVAFRNNEKGKITNQLLAIAGSGDVTQIHHFYHFLMDRKIATVNGEFSISDKIELFLKAQTKSMPFSALFLETDLTTENRKVNCHVLGIGSKYLRLANTHNSPVYLGSGKNFAQTINSKLKLNSIEIVQLTSLFEDGVGNGIDYLIPTKGPEVKTVKEYSNQTKQKHIKQLTDFICKSGIYKRENLQ